MNTIQAIINTSPPEPKALAAELTADMVVDSIEPSNNYGKDQFEISAKIMAIDQFYSKKYWVLQSMPGAKELQVGQTQKVAIRRRRLQQTREGVVKKGYSPEGNLLNHEWDWEIVAFNGDVEVIEPSPKIDGISLTQNTIPSIPTSAVASAVAPLGKTMPRDMIISRTAMLKSLMENHSKPVDTWERDDMGQATIVVEELVKIIYDEWK
tara:strand:- start:101 stop:727 length:627 start_codon:yes stop_codon:yes gene_type:complete